MQLRYKAEKALATIASVKIRRDDFRNRSLLRLRKSLDCLLQNGVASFSNKMSGASCKPPVISPIQDVVTTAGKAATGVKFSIDHHDLKSVALERYSSNPELLPSSNIFLGGHLQNRQLSLFPVMGRTGDATITLIAKDTTGLKGSASFKLVVSHATKQEVEESERAHAAANWHPRILISYAREDEKATETLYDALFKSGFCPWMDKQDIDPGQDWDRAIRNAIKESDFVILCVSRKIRDKRGYIQREIKLILNRLEEIPTGDIFMIPLRLEDCAVPEELAKYQYVDWFREDGYARLVRAMWNQWEKQRRS
ncbi:MAG: toll/interleukin-1 receptor domain-containing protein [Verrucomicrobia bacterium]|nr:toll/interleukin-1 receptor domain-containing protein [Verrucomicrobiota bacterium]